MLFTCQGNFLCSKDFFSSAENQNKTNKPPGWQEVKGCCEGTSIFTATSSKGGELPVPASAVGNFTWDAPEPAQKHRAFTFLIAASHSCATGDRWIHVSRLCLNPQSNNLRYLICPSLFQRNTQNPICQIFPEESLLNYSGSSHTHTCYWL